MYKKIKHLYILGNCFDLSHDIPTKYSDFKNYCEEIHPIFCNVLTKCLPKLDLSNWGNFEDALSEIDVNAEFVKFILTKIEKITENYLPDFELDINDDHFETQLKIYSDILSDIPIQNEINKKI